MGDLELQGTPPGICQVSRGNRIEAARADCESYITPNFKPCQRKWPDGGSPPVQGLYQDKPPLPFIPGSEVSGIVMEVGPKVKRFKQGDHVCATCTMLYF